MGCVPAGNLGYVNTFPNVERKRPCRQEGVTAMAAGDASVVGTAAEDAAALEREWASNPRWQGIRRDVPAAKVLRLRPSVLVEHTIARRGAERLWRPPRAGGEPAPR